MIEYSINFKKYRGYCKKKGIQIPRWFTHAIFKEVLDYLKTGQKLQACKFLTDKSRDNGTGFGTGYDFGLKWSKNDVADVIESFRVLEPLPLIRPEIPKNIITTDEVRDVLAPFLRLAHVIHSNSFIPDEVRVTHSTKDLKRVIDLVNKMNEPVSWGK